MMKIANGRPGEIVDIHTTFVRHYSQGMTLRSCSARSQLENWMCRQARSAVMAFLICCAVELEPHITAFRYLETHRPSPLLLDWFRDRQQTSTFSQTDTIELKIVRFCLFVCLFNLTLAGDSGNETS